MTHLNRPNHLIPKTGRNDRGRKAERKTTRYLNRQFDARMDLHPQAYFQIKPIVNILKLIQTSTSYSEIYRCNDTHGYAYFRFVNVPSKGQNSQ